MPTALEIIRFGDRLAKLADSLYKIQDKENQERVIRLNKILDSEDTIAINLEEEIAFVDTLYDETFLK